MMAATRLDSFRQLASDCERASVRLLRGAEALRNYFCKTCASECGLTSVLSKPNAADEDNQGRRESWSLDPLGTRISLQTQTPTSFRVPLTQSDCWRVSATVYFIKHPRPDPETLSRCDGSRHEHTNKAARRD
ncbi:unnamed protein product [Amoebophrya sp. A25]|nr:unnamed protein product [Amoebophrya sp. A25]|eukprot:GSA25T00023619001.1